MANPPESSPEQSDGSFHAIRRFISRKSGEFGLLFAVCNDTRVRDWAIAKLRKEIPGQHLSVRLKSGTVDPLSELLTALLPDSPRPVAIHLLDLAASVPSDQSHLRVLHALNLRRGQWESLSCPLILWIPEYLIGLLLKHAPDFSNWRSGSPFLISHTPDSADFSSPRTTLDITPRNAKAQREWSLLSDQKLRLARMKELGDRIDQKIDISKRQLAKSRRELALLFARENQPEKCNESLRRLRETSNSPDEIHFFHSILIDLFDAWGQSGNLHEKAEAAKLLEASAREQSIRFPEVSQWQRDLAVSLNELGEVSISLENVDEAARLFGEGLAIIKHLTERDPENSQWQRDLFVSQSKLGDLAAKQGESAEASCFYSSALEIIKELTDRDPGILAWQRDLALSFERLGNAARWLENLEEAAQFQRQAMQIRRYIVECNPDNLQWQHDLSRSYLSLGEIDVVEGDLEEAEKLYSRALDIVKNLFSQDPKNVQWQQDLSNCFEHLGDVNRRSGSFVEASEWHKKSLTNWEYLLTLDGTNRQWIRGIVGLYAQKAALALEIGNEREETNYARKCVEFLETMAADGLPLSLKDYEFLNWLRSEPDEKTE